MSMASCPDATWYDASLHITGGVAAAATVLTRLGVKPVLAQEGTPPPLPTPTGPRSSVSVPADDPRVTASDVTFPGLDDAEITAYQAMPSSGDGPFPGRAHLS